MPDASAPARPLRVLSTLALRGPCEADLFPAYAKRTGQTIDALWAPAGVLLEAIRTGAEADVAVLTPQALAALQAEGLVRPGSTIPLAASAVGLAVASGAPRPDLSTPATVREAFLAARAIAYSASGASGHHFLHLLDRLDIADRVLPRAIRVSEGLTGDQLPTGAADLAIQQLSELHLVAGIDVVGALPEALGLWTRFACGITTTSRNVEAAQRMCALAATDGFQAALRRFGLTPAP